MFPKSLPELTGPIGFAAFELDPRSGILRKHGIRVRLQEQPFRVLLALVERPGELVTREELQEKIWPSVASGDFDHSLNIAVNKIRDALGDSAAAPRFVETVPRRGYRFIAPLDRAAGAHTAPPLELVPARTARKNRWIFSAGVAGAVLLIAAGILWSWRSSSAPLLRLRRLTNDNSAKLGPVLSDGARLYFQVGSEFRSEIAQLPLSGGEPERLRAVLPGSFVSLLDITPDRQELLLTASDRRHPESAPLWTFRVADGSMRRLGALVAIEAKYSPDAKQIAFTTGRQSTAGSLWLASTDGSNPRRLLETKGSAIIAPLWSPDGHRIAFGQRNQLNDRETVWELRDGSSVRQLLPWEGPRIPTAWTRDSRLVISQAGRLCIMPSREPRLVPISSGEPGFHSLTAAADGLSFYGIGTTPLGQLQRFAEGSWQPLLDGISAEMVEYSRDGRSVAYVTYPDHELWVRRADGSRPVQLTRSPMRASVPRWSPDGVLICFLGIFAPGKPLRMYISDAGGGTPRLACQQDCSSEGDLTWGPEGNRFVYASERSLRSLDLSSGKATTFPESEQLYSPRWSPDGSIIAALDEKADSSRLKVYRVSEGKWRETPNVEGFLKWPMWSRDGKFVWYLNPPRGTIGRYDVLNDRYEDVVRLSSDEYTGSIHTWFALTSNDEPMILRRRDIQQVYGLDWMSR